MSTSTLPQREFDYLSSIALNKRIGDFLYVYREACPEWHDFSDMKGNLVRHSGQAYSDIVIVRIISESREKLAPRLITYMKELVARHDETLHEEGEKVFYGLTIELPQKQFSVECFEVMIHTGSNSCYNQEEIAYEVIAALSGVPFYKALSPSGSCCGFVRQDEIHDDAWIIYFNADWGISVEFSHRDDGTNVLIIKKTKKDWKKFKNSMYDIFAEFVQDRTGKNFERTYGFREYVCDKDNRHSIAIGITEGSSLTFSAKLPYNLSFVSFPRMKFATSMMEHIQDAFKEK